MDNIFTINWTNIKSALVSVILTTFIAAAGYIISLGDVFLINVHTLINIVALGVLTGAVSLAKSFLTTSKGSFLGAVQIATPTKQAVN